MRIVTYLPLAALPLLAACLAPAPVADPMVACAASVNAPGTYEYEESTGIPVLYPVEDGTQAGADALNACIAARMGGRSIPVAPLQSAKPAPVMDPIVDPVAAASTPTGRAGYGTCPSGASTLYGGTSYCIRPR